MTPVASWQPQDLYAAIDRARWAWEATQPQLTIDGFDSALDELDGDGQRPALKLVERVPSHAACVPPRDALESTLTAEEGGFASAPTSCGAGLAGNDRRAPSSAVSVLLNPGADPCRAPLQGQTDNLCRRVVDGQQPSSAPSLTATGADASLPRLSASAPEEGA